MDIITGEKLQNICDYYLGTPQDFSWNPYIAKQTHKCIFLDDVRGIEIKNISSIFVFTHRLQCDFQKVFDALEKITTPFILLLHNSDQGFLEAYTKLLQIPRLCKIFTQNITIPITDKVQPLPIGIANSMWEHGNLKIWEQIFHETDMTQKTQLIYFNFTIQTQKEKRGSCYSTIMSKNIPFQPNLDYYNYLKLLSTFRYCICPEGNGLDTHRFWECLYLKVIPITIRNYITEYYSLLFPIVLLETWDDVDVHTIEERKRMTHWDNYALLDFNEFKKRIRSD